MKTVLILLLGLTALSECSSTPRLQGERLRKGLGPPPPPPPSTVPEGKKLPNQQWFTQHLDHFNPSDDRTWSQKYFTNDEYYQPGGPVFLFIGGEGPASAYWMVSGAWTMYAQRVNAYLIQVEHRYYGDSHPTEDVSSDNLSYLSSEQALADLARFTVAMQDQLDLPDNKWIAFGGSYAGSLAGWYRLKYPHLVHGAVASSAPMVAQVDFKEYFEVVRDSLATVSEECNVAIQQANEELLLLVLDHAGWTTITENFRLCTPFDGAVPADISNLFEALADNFAGVVQYNNEQGIVNIDYVCGVMMDESIGGVLARYQEVNNILLGMYSESCLEHRYSAFVEALQTSTWDDTGIGAYRAWIYQTCTEYGWYQTSNSKEQPFGHEFPLEFFVLMCQDIYGAKFTSDVLYDGVSRTNAMYGGKSPQLTRVVFPNGSIDPWHAVGITSDLSSDVPAIYINGTAHCADMYLPESDDPAELNEARDRISDLIEQWLKEE